MRRPRRQGRPPHWPGSTVMRFSSLIAGSMTPSRFPPHLHSMSRAPVLGVRAPATIWSRIPTPRNNCFLESGIHAIVRILFPSITRAPPAPRRASPVTDPAASLPLEPRRTAGDRLVRRGRIMERAPSGRGCERARDDEAGRGETLTSRDDGP
jgi:hypothetical protein